ncbi:MAG: O-antigen ligase family protein [Patescibacteria group bacterium]
MIGLYTLVFILITSITLFFWKCAKFEWLDKTCTALVVSLPFERIPSLSVGGVNVRFSQLIVLAGLWIVAVLFFKKDRQLYQLNINKINNILIAFTLCSIPSFFVVIESRRFLTTILATYLAFGALFLLSNFSNNIPRKLKYLVLSVATTSIFGLYQFVGDLVDLPTYLTGLREMYTKVVFGIPRVQATALEPLYYAGMLFMPILYILVMILAGVQLNVHPKIKSRYAKLILLTLFLSVFVLTLSKAAFAIMTGIFILLSLCSAKKLKSIFLFKQFIKLIFVSVSVLSIFTLFFPNLRITVLRIIINFYETATFQFASSIERLNFLQAAIELLPRNVLIGIGSGQYGPWVKSLGLVNSPVALEGGYLIVNNVYLEVWLEFGILALICFLALLLYPVYNNFKILNSSSNWKTPNNLSRLVLVFTLIAYYLQWFTFSPIFIMPIFILMGLAANLGQNNDTIYESKVS